MTRNRPFQIARVNSYVEGTVAIIERKTCGAVGQRVDHRHEPPATIGVLESRI